MTQDRIHELATIIWNHAFVLLNAEPDLTGNDAGEIATATEHAFQAALARRVE